jgi:hypothetical protein
VGPATICRQSKKGQNPLFFGTSRAFGIAPRHEKRAHFITARTAKFKDED